MPEPAEGSEVFTAVAMALIFAFQLLNLAASIWIGGKLGNFAGIACFVIVLILSLLVWGTIIAKMEIVTSKTKRRK